MNPQLQAFLDLIKDMKAQANATLKAMPPIEQFQASQELAWCFESLQRQGNSLVEFAENLSKQIGEVANKITSTATAEAKTTLLASGELISKADHDAAVTAAANTRETEVRGAIASDAEKFKLLIVRRDKLVSDKVLPAIAAERMPVVQLEGDGYLANAELVKGRLAKLIPFGITPETAAEAVAEIASIPLGEDGEKIFQGRFKLIESACSASRKATGGGGQLNPLASPAPGAAAAASAEAGGGDKPTVRRNLL